MTKNLTGKQLLRRCSSEEHPSPVPAEWIRFQQVFYKAEEGLVSVQEKVRKQRRQYEQKLTAFQWHFRTDIPFIKVSRHLPESVASSIIHTIKELRKQQELLLEKFYETLEDFNKAKENEDRFVVLVFGEVNSGKSALANHVAGLDFDLPPSFPRGTCFTGDIEVDRLEEKPIECTRQYQGFRLPGLLWIDCPGILSGTEANAQLAKRLVTVADFIVFVSTSDAPLKISEMKELAQLIKASGQEQIDACLVITKADTFDEDEDPVTGRDIRKIVPKSRQDWQNQADWCREQLATSDLGKYLRFREPMAVSVYVARDALGRDWENGSFFRTPDKDWEAKYKASGIPDFLNMLSELMLTQGAELKAAWPKKRAAALQSALKEIATKARDDLKEISQKLRALQTEFWQAESQAAQSASAMGCAAVAPCLEKHGIHDAAEFQPVKAQEELTEALRQSVEKAIDQSTKEVLKNIVERCNEALNGYIQKTDFELHLKRKFKVRTYKSTTKSEAIGKTIGRAIGTGAGFLIPIPLIGQIAAGTFLGFIGSQIGKLIGQKAYTEKVRVRVPAGTNAAEVIADTQKQMEAHARKLIKRIFDNIDRIVFRELLDEIDKLHQQAEHWCCISVMPSKPKGTIIPRKRKGTR